jgi:hypothetical protein
MEIMPSKIETNTVKKLKVNIMPTKNQNWKEEAAEGSIRVVENLKQD